MNLGTNMEETNIGTIVSDFTMLLNRRLQQFQQKISTDNKIGIETMEVLKELPMVKILEAKLSEKNRIILKLKAEIAQLKGGAKIQLQTNEILDDDSNVSYNDISDLVEAGVKKLEADRITKITKTSTWFDYPLLIIPS